MKEYLYIQVGLKLNKAINEANYPVSSENAAKFIVDMTSLQSAEAASIKNAIEFVLNDMPYYLTCDVTAMDSDDTISVSIMDSFCETVHGDYNEWLKRYNLTEEKLSKDIKSYKRLVQRLVNGYSRRFGNSLLSLSTY